MKEFLTQFYKQIYTEERRAYYRQEQEKYPILKNHYAVLVPEHVTYEDFWQRYDYRLDLDRIFNELQLQESATLANSLGKVKKKFMSFIPEDMNAASTTTTTTTTTTTGAATGGGGSSDGVLQNNDKETASAAAAAAAAAAATTTTTTTTTKEENSSFQQDDDRVQQKNDKDTAAGEENVLVNDETVAYQGNDPDDDDEIVRILESEESANENLNYSSIYVYPESPESPDDEPSPSHDGADNNENKLLGAVIFILNDIDESISEMI